jgi:hypothetical protein
MFFEQPNKKVIIAFFNKNIFAIHSAVEDVIVQALLPDEGIFASVRHIKT